MAFDVQVLDNRSVTEGGTSIGAGRLASARTSVDRHSHGDAAQPATETSSVAQLMQTSIRLDEYVLGQLFSFCVITQLSQRGREHRGLVAHNQFTERVAVTFEGRGDQLLWIDLSD